MQRGIEREVALGNLGENFLVDTAGAKVSLEFTAATGPIDLAFERGEGIVEIEQPQFRVGIRRSHGTIPWPELRYRRRFPVSIR